MAQGKVEVSPEALKQTLPERADIGDPEYVKQRDKISKLVKQSEANDWREILALPAGRRIFWRILHECRMFGISFNSENQYVTAHCEGMRVIGKWLNDTLAAMSKDDYKLMWQENFIKETK